MRDKVYDIVQIGYGPVSETLALMLGRQGRSVAVCERWIERYPLPRAVCIDHELYRVLSANGMRDVLPSVTHAGSLYQWFNADWQQLIAFDWARPSISGGPEINFVHQPTLEGALDAHVREQPTVDLHLGWEAVSFEQTEDMATVEVRETATGLTRQLSARYIVGCDGANSVVRQAIGGEQQDRGFEADWLVVDVLLKQGVTIEQLGLPAAGQYCNPARPTTIVPAGVRDGRLFRRWEFMRLPGEDISKLEQEETVWRLLEPWAGPDHVELVRHKIYNFRSLMASKWRDRRLLVAGDAAHVMPPFMGQGMCSGMRDAWNLAWKFGLILDGKAEDRLLDTYQIERLPHVSQITDMGIYLGKIICIPDKSAAAARDAAFFSGEAPPPPPFPQLDHGLLHHRANALEPGAGLLAPHVEICHRGRRLQLDELTGPGHFVIIARDFDAEAILGRDMRLILAQLGTRYVTFAEHGLAADSYGDVAEDLDGRISVFLDAHGWSSMVIRPDFYVYGGARNANGLCTLVKNLITDLKAAGFHESVNINRGMGH